MSAPRSTSFDDFSRTRAVMLTTFRRDGTPVGTPIWLVVRGGAICATTAASSGKVKRIRNDPRVRVAACTQLGRLTGPTHEGTARIMDPAETAEVLARIRRRYGLLDRVFSRINRLQGESDEVALEVTPAL